MGGEHWADEEIRNLRGAKAKLEAKTAEAADQEERENIWKRALLRPEEGWRFPPILEGEFRRSGFFQKPSAKLTYGNLSASSAFFKFKRNLLEGACEYFMNHPRGDNRITARSIYDVLRSSKEFGRLISYQSVYNWTSGASKGFNDIVENYAIDYSPTQSINERYAAAIRAWWRTHPDLNTAPTYADIARILKLTPSAVFARVSMVPALHKLMQERPSDRDDPDKNE